MVSPRNPASPRRLEKSSSQQDSQESTAGCQSNLARSACRNSRIDTRSSANSVSLAHNASKEFIVCGLSGRQRCRRQVEVRREVFFARSQPIMREVFDTLVAEHLFVGEEV